MQIVIEISDSKYQWVKDNPLTYDNEYCEAIRNGTPLPKGHGRLIDADKLESRMKIGYCIVRDAPTIIEADKAGEEE